MRSADKKALSNLRLVPYQIYGKQEFFGSANKAINNVNVAWRKYYVHILKGEIVNKAFQNTPIPDLNIINTHDFSTKPLNATFPHRNIPTMYWLPK